MRGAMPRAQADKGAPRMRVEMRRSLAAEVRQKDQSLRTWRDTGCKLTETLVVPCLHNVPPPMESTTRRQRHPHEVIPRRHGVAESVNSARRVPHKLIGIREQDSARADRAARQPFGNDA